MATVAIFPIYLKSIGGFDVTITGIRPDDHDCLVGTINTPGRGLINGSWDLSGLLRDGDASTNLDMTTNEMINLAALAIKLGVTR